VALALKSLVTLNLLNNCLKGFQGKWQGSLCTLELLEILKLQVVMEDHDTLAALPGLTSLHLVTGRKKGPFFGPPAPVGEFSKASVHALVSMKKHLPQLRLPGMVF